MIVLSSALKEQLADRKVSLNGKGLGPGEWLQFAQDLVKIVNEQEKGGNLKLEGLLFQAYRRQQNSVRDRFSMLAQTLLAKAEVKYQQILSTIDILAEIDEF